MRLGLSCSLLFLVVIASGCGEQELGSLQNLGAITAKVPASWRSETPSSRMRKAQFVLGKQAPDQDDATLVVFYFGLSQGGSVEANLARWFGQFKQPDGRSSEETAQVSKREVGGMPVTLADVSGTYAPSAMRPMAPTAPPRTGYRMLAAIVESPVGSYYFKLTGPEGTVDHWSDAFSKFVDSIEKK
jgi:hypothetical protein